MDRKRSAIWKYFTSVGNKGVKCHECSKVFSHKSGSTSNMRKHLNSRHPELFENGSSSKGKIHVTSNFEDDPLADFERQTCRLSSSAPIKNEDINTHEHSMGNVQAPTSSDRSFTTTDIRIETVVPEYTTEEPSDTYISHTESVSRQSKLDDCLLDMIARGMHPFSMVDGEGFRGLTNALDPSYHLPSGSVLRRVLMSRRYKKVLKRVKLQLCESEYVCLTTDGWTSTSGNFILSVTAHYLSKNWELKSILLNTFRFGSTFGRQKIIKEIVKMARDWKINNKISSVITGHIQTIKFVAKHIGWKYLKCFSYTINTIVDEGLTTIKPLHNKVKSVVEFFHQNTLLEERLKGMQFEIPPDGEPLRLKNDVQTRWITTYNMFYRIYELREPLQAVIATLDVNNETIPNLSADEWESLREILQILAPFKQVANEFCEEKNVPASKIILLQNGLRSAVERKQLKLKSSVSKLFVDNILESMKKEFSNIEDTFAAKACFLDPRFKNHGFIGLPNSTVENVKQSLTDELNQLIGSINDIDQNDMQNNTLSQIQSNSDSEEDSLLWSEFNSRVKQSTKTNIPSSTGAMEFESFLEEPLLCRTECPLKWWKGRESHYPQLSKLSKKYLGILATTVPGERFFTRNGYEVMNRRKRMRWNIVRQLVFLAINA